MKRWFRFYETVYREMMDRRLGSCPVGTTCAPDGWACCSVWGGAEDKLEVAMLPHEAWWQQNQDVVDLRSWDSGCPGCMPKKGILCQLWPVIPVLPQSGQAMIQLWLSCEALILAPKEHVPLVHFASWLNRLIDHDFRILQHEFFSTVQETFIVKDEIAVMMSAGNAQKLLFSESAPQLLKTLMEACGVSKPMNDGYRRLPLLLNQ